MTVAFEKDVKCVSSPHPPEPHLGWPAKGLLLAGGEGASASQQKVKEWAFLQVW